MNVAYGERVSSTTGVIISVRWAVDVNGCFLNPNI